MRPHEHWHVDVSYINVASAFFYRCSLLDGRSRYIVHWEIRASMTEPEVEMIVQRARERFPDARPRIISDNGPQFITRDFQGAASGWPCCGSRVADCLWAVTVGTVRVTRTEDRATPVRDPCAKTGGGGRMPRSWTPGLARMR